ncbi:alpha/beta hydrolase [Photobacterium makurazakiensis]|uniref:alpha/beta fold hydrolase n=1 Tax=Photobacterium makurazakiensis TaxID=2910234 RepID=UPI003D10A19A
MRKKLYLIPGTMCTEKLWTEILPYLYDSLELVYLDIPQGKNFDELAEHYHNIFGSDTVNLIGFSLGGYIATYYAMLHPNQIEKLFVISNSPTNLSVEELEQRSDILKYVKTYGYKGMSRNKVASLLDSKNQTDQLIDLILEMDNALGESEFISQYKCTSERVDLSQSIIQFPFYTHLYYSDNDSLINSKWLNELDNISPRLSLISTSGSGHMLPLEKPRELAQYINSWVEL